MFLAQELSLQYVLMTSNTYLQAGVLVKLEKGV